MICVQSAAFSRTYGSDPSQALAARERLGGPGSRAGEALTEVSVNTTPKATAGNLNMLLECNCARDFWNADESAKSDPSCWSLNCVGAWRHARGDGTFDMLLLQVHVLAECTVCDATLRESLSEWNWTA